MRYNRLGSTGLFVSELCLGTMTFGGDETFSFIGTVQQDEADALVACALQGGINFIDTANMYSSGLSERITGQALRNVGVKRSDVVIATKAFGETGKGPNERGSSRSNLIDSLSASLERLQLDYIDLFQLHGFDPATPMEETMRALDDLVRQGLVRYVGVSNWSAWQVAKANGIAKHHGLTTFASLQAYYTIAGRDVEREIVPMLTSEGLGMLVWSPLAGGLLSGKYSRDTTSVADSRRTAFQFPPVEMERAWDVIDAMKPIAATKNVSVAQLALGWLLQRPSVSSVIIGARRVGQLADNVGAVSVTFTVDELAVLDAVSKLPVEYPGWMTDMWSASRAAQLQNSRT